MILGPDMTTPHDARLSVHFPTTRFRCRSEIPLCRRVLLSAYATGNQTKTTSLVTYICVGVPGVTYSRREEWLSGVSEPRNENNGRASRATYG
jgi:hypothetical protein